MCAYIAYKHTYIMYIFIYQQKLKSMTKSELEKFTLISNLIAYVHYLHSVFPHSHVFSLSCSVFFFLYYLYSYLHNLLLARFHI